MSALSDKLRTMGVFNTHDVLMTFAEKGEDIACTFYPYQARQVSGGGTKVYSPSHKTDPTAHWQDNGCKSFAGNIRESMPKAIEWASEKYRIEKWSTDPTNRTAKIPAMVRHRAEVAVKSMKVAVLSERIQGQRI